MPLMPILLFLFLAVPLVEIYLLIEVGSRIGALPTVALVVGTAVLGAALLRHQGLATLGRARSSLDQGELPAVELLEGVALLLGGALLLTPGFVTDAFGFLCLVPALRRALIARLAQRLIVERLQPRDPSGPRTIEGEFRRED